MPVANPYVDPRPFGRCTIGGEVLTGVIVSINGVEKPEDITFQKGTSGNNAVTIWNGTKLMESATILLKLHTAEQFAAHEAVRRKLRPKIGDQPPTLEIVNPIFNGEGVTRVVCRSAPPPLWTTPGGYWSAPIVLAEFNPPTKARAGVPTPTPPQTAGEREFARLAKEAAAL